MLSDMPKIDPSKWEQNKCRRTGCGHHRHSHLNSGDRSCTVKRVSGGPEPDGAPARPVRGGATDAELHPGRTVTRCPCVGFLS